MKLRSMTGFARLAECLAGIDVLFSIKSLNHRGLDMHFYAGAELDPFENAMRAAVKRSVARGHIDIRVQLNRAGAAGPLAIDMPKLDAYVNAFALASHKYQLSTPLDLNAALRIPGIL
ncbi:MAG: YicC family protein, partial [Bryobacteraceae bacterium]|nr:YicC family protein [Bryobacteraceae bacterium]